jgi:hypothetical protein
MISGEVLDRYLFKCDLLHDEARALLHWMLTDESAIFFKGWIAKVYETLPLYTKDPYVVEKACIPDPSSKYISWMKQFNKARESMTVDELFSWNVSRFSGNRIFQKLCVRYLIFTRNHNHDLRRILVRYESWLKEVETAADDDDEYLCSPLLRTFDLFSRLLYDSSNLDRHVERLVHVLSKDSMLQVICIEENWDVQKKINEIVFFKIRNLYLLFGGLTTVYTPHSTNMLQYLAKKQIDLYLQHFTEGSTTTSEIKSEIESVVKIHFPDKKIQYIRDLKTSLLVQRCERFLNISDLLYEYVDTGSKNYPMLVESLVRNMDLVFKMLTTPRGCRIMDRVLQNLQLYLLYERPRFQKDAMWMLVDRLMKKTWNLRIMGVVGREENIGFYLFLAAHPEKQIECIICFDEIPMWGFYIQCATCSEIKMHMNCCTTLFRFTYLLRCPQCRVSGKIQGLRRELWTVTNPTNTVLYADAV